MNSSDSIFLSTKEGYDRWAEIYDADDIPLNLLEEPYVDAELGEVHGLNLLDLACGTGRQSLRQAKRGANVVGVDQSTGMLEKARQKAVSTSVKFIEHNVDTPLPFADQSFDRVVSFLALEHISDLVSFFKESRRVCTSEGFLLFTAMHPGMLLKGVQARFTHPETQQKVYPKGFAYKTADYVNAALEAGLCLVSLHEGACTETHVSISQRAEKYLHWPLLLGLKFHP